MVCDIIPHAPLPPPPAVIQVSWLHAVPGQSLVPGLLVTLSDNTRGCWHEVGVVVHIDENSSSAL
eukprot:11461537-Ditylum_brightwellii.AAC.1